jgi:hypothetical protein
MKYGEFLNVVTCERMELDCVELISESMIN